MTFLFLSKSCPLWVKLMDKFLLDSMKSEIQNRKEVPLKNKTSKIRKIKMPRKFTVKRSIKVLLLDEKIRASMGLSGSQTWDLSHQRRETCH